MDNFVFKEDTHEYFLNGEKLAGVSSVLRYTGFNDISRIPENVLEPARLFGNAVHKACELYDRGTLDIEILDPELALYLTGWKKFLKDYKVRIVDIEKHIYSKKWKCAGTLDRIAMIGKERVLVDIKSTTTMNPAVALQTAGYKIMDEEMTGLKIHKRLGIRLLLNNYKPEPYKDKIDEITFLSCLNVRAWKKLHNIKP